MKTVEVLKQHIYARRNRRLGQIYQASDKDVDLLTRMRLVRILPDPPAATPPPPSPAPIKAKPEPPKRQPEPEPAPAIPTPQPAIETFSEPPAIWSDPYREIGMDPLPADPPEPQAEADEEKKPKRKYKRRDLEAEGD